MEKVNTCTPISFNYIKPRSGEDRIVENSESQIQIKNGAVLNSVVVFGRVWQIEDRDGHRAMLIDDTSKTYVLKDYSENPTELTTRDFITAYGSMRKNKNGEGFYFTAHDIKIAEKQQQDQMSVKYLETLMAQLKGAAGRQNGGSATVQSTSNGKKETVNTGHANLPLKDGISPDHNKVLAVVLGNELEEGAKVPEDFSHLGLAEEKVRSLLASLADEGHIYSTVDDNHFKST